MKRLIKSNYEFYVQGPHFPNQLYDMVDDKDEIKDIQYSNTLNRQWSFNQIDESTEWKLLSKKN